MVAPLVAVVCYRLAPGRVSRWDDGALAVPEPYVAALRRAGARPVLLAPPDPGPPEEVLAPFDALLLVGGGDVHPARYGARPHPSVYGLDPDRDELEVALVLAADRLGVPALGVCRGLQVVNVAFGGTLHQHLVDVPGLGPHGAPTGGEGVLHEVKVAEGSRLAEACGRTSLSCLSWHHQGIDRLAEGLVPVAWAGDGLVEGVERERGWLVAVQWHPEATAGSDPAQQALFDALVREAMARASARSRA